MLDKLAGVSQKLGPGLRQVLSNIAWLFTDQILQMGLGLVVGLWVARYLKPNDFGLLTYAITFVSLFSAVASMGWAESSSAISLATLNAKMRPSELPSDCNLLVV
jgi:Membrane protein involved in the export of O-antigen and teichoic acid